MIKPGIQRPSTVIPRSAAPLHCHPEDSPPLSFRGAPLFCHSEEPLFRHSEEPPFSVIPRSPPFLSFRGACDEESLRNFRPLTSHSRLQIPRCARDDTKKEGHSEDSPPLSFRGACDEESLRKCNHLPLFSHLRIPHCAAFGMPQTRTPVPGFGFFWGNGKPLPSRRQVAARGGDPPLSAVSAMQRYIFKCCDDIFSIDKLVSHD